MKKAKLCAIWLGMVVVMVFCVNLIGTFVVKGVLDNLLTPAMLGYAAKGETMLHPTLKEPDEENKTNGLSGLAIRALLDDTRIMNGTNFLGNFIFMNVTVDQSVIMFDKDGLSTLSKGIYANVYEEQEEEGINHIRHCVGLLNIRDFCELDCAEDVYQTLKEHPGAVIKVNSYSNTDFLIQPASITILDSSGNTVKTYDCPCSGEIILSDITYIYDDNSGGIENDLHGFCNEMTLAYVGERTSDKIAEKLVDEIEFTGSDQSVHKPGYGFGHYASKSYEVRGDYAMISVFNYDFTGSIIVYGILSCILATLLTMLIKRR